MMFNNQGNNGLALMVFAFGGGFFSIKTKYLTDIHQALMATRILAVL